jgi:hypothetical protein
MLVGVPVALDAESYEILGRVIAQSAPWLNVMDLKVFHASARLAPPAISREDLATKFSIGFRIELQSRPFRPYSRQRVSCTS